jgi:hypothetical protein
MSMKLCCGNFAVPYTEEIVLLDEVNVGRTMGILDLSSRNADLAWLERALGMKSRAFRAEKWPVLEEIQQGIETHRKKTFVKWGRKRPHCVIQLELGHQKILVKNSARTVYLLFDPQEEAKGGGVLQWLVERFVKERAERSNDGPSRSTSSTHEEPRETLETRDNREEMIGKEIVETLRQNAKVKAVCWAPSKRRVVVTGPSGRLYIPISMRKRQRTPGYLKDIRKDMIGKEIPGPDDEDQEAVEQTLAAALNRATVFLEDEAAADDKNQEADEQTLAADASEELEGAAPGSRTRSTSENLEAPGDCEGEAAASERS